MRHTSHAPLPAREEEAAHLRGLISAVREHAQAHYHEGWDIVVEAMEDSELLELILESANGDTESPLAVTAKQAVTRVALMVEVHNDALSMVRGFTDEPYTL